MKKIYFLSLLFFVGSISYAQCDLSVSFEYEIVDDVVFFTNTSTGEPDDPEYLWIIAEEEYDIENPSVDFDEAYLYPSVYFEITGTVDGERCYDSTWLYIEELVDSCDLEASFTWVLEDGRYYFTNTSTGEDGESIYQWSVDGTDWSELENPSIGEDDIVDGTVICFEILDDITRCTETFCYTFRIDEEPCGLLTNFTYEVIGDRFYFTNTSTGEGDASVYSWTFEGVEFSDDENSSMETDGVPDSSFVCFEIYDSITDCRSMSCLDIHSDEFDDCGMIVDFTMDVEADRVYFIADVTDAPSGAAYEWFDDGVLISEDMSPDFALADIAPESYICLRVSDDLETCSETDCDIFFSEDELSIEVVQVTDFSIYPNPARTQINIQFTENVFNQGQIEIYNSIGERILTQTINGNSSTEIIDLNSLSKGLYIIRAIDLNAGISTQKRFVKQ